MGFVENVNKLASGITDTLQDELITMQNDITDLQTNKVDIVVGKQLSTEDYTTGEKDKLAGINPGATANQTDTYLLNRDNHTGTQTADTIEETLSRVFVTPTQKGLISTAEQVGNKNVAGGYAGINGAGKIDSGFLPDLNVSQVFPNVPDEASMLALPAGLGDIAIRTDLGDAAFMCISIPATTIVNWRQLNTAAAVTSVNSKIGAVLLDTGDISENGNLYYTDERVDDRVASLLVAGNNVSLSYDDVVSSITISANDTSVAFSEITGTPTTLSGYGISDAYTKTQIDSNTQPLDATLTAVAGVSTSADKIIYFTGVDTAAATTLSSFGRTLIDDADASTALSTLGAAADSETVHKTGAETIAGVKTFTSSPIVPTPTTDSQAATKKYVDDNIGGGGGGVRQTVQVASVDSGGYANYISIGTGLSVNIAAAAKNIKINAAGGDTDRLGTISADTAISGLTANTTNYLYADIASNGTVTLGFTTVAPVYQFGGTYSTTNNQHTFKISEMTMKVGNGSTASQVWRVFLGEAVTGASTVTSIVNYALNGRYDSGLFATSPSTNYPKAHNIGVQNVKTTIHYADDASGTNERVSTTFVSGSSSYGYYGGGSTKNTQSVVTLATASGLTISGAPQNSYYRMICKRSW